VAVRRLIRFMVAISLEWVKEQLKEF
jgi:hypothetical protein